MAQFVCIECGYEAMGCLDCGVEIDLGDGGRFDFLHSDYFNARWQVVSRTMKVMDRAAYLEYCLLKVRKVVPLHLEIVLALHKRRADLNDLVISLILARK